jgi:homoserine dehydrogenase
MSAATRPLRIAILGCGNVGSEVVRQLDRHAGDLAQRVGAPLEIVGIAVRRPTRARDLTIDAGLFTADAAGLVAREDVDVVIEVVGGIEPVRSLLVTALERGASVVTANKALLAEDGETLYAAAARGGADLYCEASVGAAIPLLRPLRESLAGDRVTRVMGIVNGTTNYILSQMHATGAGYADALDEAQSLGYAEADPTADVDGFDAAAKAAILAGLAFHTRVTGADVYREGIGEVTTADITSAREMDGVVKLLAIAERGPDRAGRDSIGVRVHPAILPVQHPLAGVRDAYNAVFIEADAAGQLMFYGRGAGGAPTASAVLGDLVAVCRNRLTGARSSGDSSYAALPIRAMGETITRYHVSLDVADKAGVLASVAHAFAAHDVSIQTVRQEGRGDDATLVLVSHEASDAALSATVEDLRALDAVRAVASVMRVEGGLG